MSRKITAALVASALVFSNAVAYAADANQAALAPGKPAGVKEAQMEAPLWIWIAGVGLVALGVALVASGGNNGSAGNTTTNSHP